MAQKAEIKGKINLDSSGFKRGIAQAKKSLKGFTSSAAGQFAQFGAAFASVGLVKNIVGLGTAAAETASKFEAVFGSATSKMNEEVQKLRETIPATTAEVQNSLATFSQMATAFGMGADQANKFSVSMTQMAGDLASFHNLEPEEVFTKLSAAISGEFEPLKRLGIVINADRLKQEAFNIGISDGTKALNASQKAIAVQSIVLKDMGVALGDAARTADSAANKIKFLKANLVETGSEIGVTILPAVDSLTSGFGFMLSKVKGTMEGIGAVVGKTVNSVANLENGFAGYDGVFSTAAKGSWRLNDSLNDLNETSEEATSVQDEYSDQIDNTTESIEDQEKALKAIQDQLKEYYNKQKEAIDLEREQFIKEKELEQLRLKASGNKAEADALQTKIDKMKEAIEMSDKYGISLKDAASLVERLRQAEDGGSASQVASSGGGSPSKPRSNKRGSNNRYGSRFGDPQTMRERELASGLYNTTLGRDGAEMDGLKASEKATQAQDPQKEMADTLKSIDETLKENPE